MDYHIDYRYMRPRKAAILQQWQSRPFVCRSDLGAVSYPNAGILPIKAFSGDNLAWGRGGMVDADGEYIADSAMWQLYAGAYPVDSWDTRDEKVVFCGYFIQHWGHFLLDSLSRGWYFLKDDPSVQKYVYVVESGASTVLDGNFREFFSLLGILDKLEIINRPTRYREVILPDLGYNRDAGYWSEEYKQLFGVAASRVQPEPNWEPRKRVYMSRGRLEKALNMEAGLDFLDHYFAKNGYEVLYPETQSLSYLIFLLNNAELVACESGSLQHNLLFCQDGKQLVVVERYAFNNRESTDINVIKGIQSTLVDGNLSLYPVELAYGPFLFYYNHWFEAFTRDRGYLAPDDAYLTDAYRRKLLKKYYKAYMDEHHYQWYMGQWMIPSTDSLYEAYQDSVPYFEDFIKGRKPFLTHHYFKLHYYKQFIKRLLGRL